MAVCRLILMSFALCACATPPPAPPVAHTIPEMLGTRTYAVELQSPRWGRLMTSFELSETVAFEARTLGEADLRLEGELTVTSARSLQYDFVGRLSGFLGQAKAQGSLDTTGFMLLLEPSMATPTELRGPLEGVLDGACLKGLPSQAAAGLPLTHREGLVRDVRGALSLNLYDARLLERANWQRFLEDFEVGLTAVRDDLGAALVFVQTAQDYSLDEITLIGTAYAAEAARVEGQGATKAPAWPLLEGAQLVSSASIDQHLSAAPLDLRGVVLDLRAQGDLDLHVLRLGAWFGLSAADFGFFQANALHRAGASAREPSQTPVLPLSDVLARHTSTWPGVFQIDPGSSPEILRLPVVAILDQSCGAGATCLAMALQRRRGALLVGSAPSRPGRLVGTCPLGAHWRLRLPVAQQQFIRDADLKPPTLRIDLPSSQEGARAAALAALARR